MRHVGSMILLAAVAIAAGCRAAPTIDGPASAPAPDSAPASVAAPATTPATTPTPARAPSPPYYTGDAAALFAVLPPAPMDGDARDVADRRIFRETRALAGSPRWQMAADDAEAGSAAMLRHFACSLDVGLTPQQAPRLVALLQKATREAGQSAGKAKDYYKRHRPFTVDEGPTCVAPSTVGTSFDYPSGHTTAGWAWALVLAQVDPQRALPILARGRAIGDSRVVCGMHNASAVEGARMLTGAAISLVAASDLYQTDLAAARVELAGLRAQAPMRPEPARCAQEQELVKPYW